MCTSITLRWLNSSGIMLLAPTCARPATHRSLRPSWELNAPMVGIDRAVRRSYRLSRVSPGRFLCSGFVQYGFMTALRRLTASGQLPTSALDDAIFNDRIGRHADDAAILATTPQDFAQSDKLAWRYVIRRRRVYRVTSYDEVDRILRRR